MVGKRKRIRIQVKSAQKRHADKLSINPKYLASCYGKVRRTKDEANAEVKLKPSIVKPYKCKFCPWYHMGRKKDG